ncbi:DUF1353 domain-containing protein [Nocardia wallacei]|uniref:DUF1353 domain-containing protein n=1 Tax=Nocardia wallacei TaxID=480035 RepID=A0A7G1KNY6_9NOCA|nr:DUF1353 domain-containing protein [Nocardia wallacei]BCK56962.1 hypothetical protein NWFMUON74_47340 [Nocardia wallacei]
MGFTGGALVVEELDAESWCVREPIEYRGDRETFVVPAGFRTDFASVPRALVWLIPRYGAFTKAAILHDYLSRAAEVSRADADGLFRRALHEQGVSVPQRWMMWAAVRLGSGLRGATVGDIAKFLLVAIPSVIFLVVPVVIVQLWLLLFWVVEAVFWTSSRVTGRVTGPAPKPRVKMTT